MGEFRVHHCRFFDYFPQAIHCLAYNEANEKLALSRADGSIEIWSVRDNWYQEQLVPPVDDQLVEAMVWAQSRLFSAGLHGNLQEYDLLSCRIKNEESSNSGAVWCLACNEEETLIAAGTEDGCIVLFEITDEGPKYLKGLDKQEGRILSLAWNNADNLIVTGGVDNIRIWSVNSGHAIQRLTLPKQDRNRETIVWSIAVTDDFTIISGDSRGKLCFWNGKQGTLIKSVQSHKADVLSLCVNKSGDSVFASGVDPNLVQFEFIPTQPNSDWKMWVKSNVRYQHTHDVRAVCIAGQYVVSGGVDCSLILNHMSHKREKGMKSTRKLPAIPQRPLVCTAHKAKVIMLQYPNYLEIWRLGATSRTSEKGGEILPLKQNAVKLLELKARGDGYITAASISDNAEWIVYSDVDTIRIFQLTLEDMEAVAPKVALSRVRFVPPGTLPSVALAFTPDGSKVVSVTNQGTLQVLGMDSVQPFLISTIIPASDARTPIHLLSVSPNGKSIATGDSNHDVHVYDLKKSKLVCTLPRYHCKPCALTFSPSSKEVLVAYCDQKFYEYNMPEKEYTTWSRLMSKKFHSQWLERYSKLCQVLYHPEKPHQIIMRDEGMLCIIDKTQPLPEHNRKLFYSKSRAERKDVKVAPHAFHICSKFKYMMHLDVLEDNFLMVVEQTPMTLLEKLPPTLKQKKFGT